MDVIKQLMLGGGSMLAKIFTGKDESNDHTIIVEALSPTDIHMLINGLVSEGRINDAEDILFEFMEKSPSGELYKTGVDFFARLNNFADDYLTECNYSREEIEKGIADFEDLKRRSVIF